MSAIYTLWLFNIAMENDPFIDGLPSYKMGIFHGYVTNNQMVSPTISPLYPPAKHEEKTPFFGLSKHDDIHQFRGSLEFIMNRGSLYNHDCCLGLAEFP